MYWGPQSQSLFKHVMSNEHWPEAEGDRVIAVIYNSGHVIKIGGS